MYSKLFRNFEYEQGSYDYENYLSFWNKIDFQKNDV